MFPSVPGRGPPDHEMTNFPIFNNLPTPLVSPLYLTDSAPESNLIGNGAACPFQPHLLPHYGHTMAPHPPMHPPSRTAISSYTDTSSHQRIPIAVVDENERAVPLSGINPPFATHDAPWSYIPPAYLLNGSIPGAHHVSYPYVASPSESTSDAPGSASPTALQFPQIHSSPSLPSTYKAFIDDHPMINKAYDCAKERVASYPILKASTARRTNPATFECDICKATFTRSHNLGYHRDAHFRIKKHISLCGKKFGTPSGSKRHQVTCLTCKARKDSPSPA